MVSARAARVETVKEEDKWKSKARILKRRQEKEKDFAAPRTVKAGVWMPASTPIEKGNEEEEEKDEEMLEVVEASVPENPAKTPRKRTEKAAATARNLPQREKYMDVLRKQFEAEKCLENVLDQTVTIKFRDLLCSSDILSKLLFGRLPNMKDDIPVVNAQVSAVKHREESVTFPSATPKMRCKIGDEEYSSSVLALLDSGAEVNVLSKNLADTMELPIRTDQSIVLRSVQGDMRTFTGFCEDVAVDVGGVVNYQTFMVIDDFEYNMILGCPFFHDSQCSLTFDGEGAQIANFMSEDRKKRACVRVAKPQGREVRDSRRVGSFQGNE